MNWTVAQSKNQIKAGDHVYVWQSGPEGGVIADGTILTDPGMSCLTRKGSEEGDSGHATDVGARIWAIA